MRLVRAVTILLAAAALFAAAGVRLARESRGVAVSERSYGQGRDRVWLFSPGRRKPRAVVVFVHGAGGEKETTPYYHQPWLQHLALEGYDVLYPKYELFGGQSDSLQHLVT